MPDKTERTLPALGKNEQPGQGIYRLIGKYIFTAGQKGAKIVVLV